MTIATLDPRTRVRNLLEKIEVTNVVTRKPLHAQAKLGRVIAACRGHVATLVSINWGTTTPEEVREALDEMREAD